MQITTLYCHQPHRLNDGQPVDHKCRVIPPEILEAEVRGDIETVVSYFENPFSPLILSNGVPAEESQSCR